MRSRAFELLSDQQVIARGARESADLGFRMRLTNKLTDAECLLSVAVEPTGSENISWAALQKLSGHEGLLVKVARDSPFPGVRVGAVGKLKGEVTLAKLANEGADERVKAAASEQLKKIREGVFLGLKLPDLQVLLKNNDGHSMGDYVPTNYHLGIFRHQHAEPIHPDSSSKRWSIEQRIRELTIIQLKQLTDLGEIRAALEKEPDQWVREAVVKTVVDPGLLAHLARNDPSDYVRQDATERLDKRDQATLSAIAQNDASKHVRMAAIYRLTDQALLVSVREVCESFESVTQGGLKSLNRL